MHSPTIDIMCIEKFYNDEESTYMQSQQRPYFFQQTLLMNAAWVSFNILLNKEIV